MSSNLKQNESDDVKDIIKSYNLEENIKEALANSQVCVNQILSKIDSPEDFQKQALRKAQDSREAQKELAVLLAFKQKIKTLIRKNSSKDIWWEKLPKLLPDNRKIISHDLNKLDENITLAIESLCQSSDNIYFAKHVRYETEKTVCKYKYPRSGFLIQWFLQIYHSPSIPVKVLSGLISAIFIYGSITFGIIMIDRTRSTIGEYLISLKSLEKREQKENISPELQINESSKDQKNLNTEALKLSPSAKHIEALDEIALALAGGTLGSIISILIRIEQFRDKKYLDSMTPFLIGAVKPIIGGGFGVFFLAFINSQIFLNPNVFKLNNDVDQKKSIIFAVAFIVGFSERLAKDAIGKAEDILSSHQSITENRQTNLQVQDSEDGSKGELSVQAQTTTTQTQTQPRTTEQ